MHQSFRVEESKDITEVSDSSCDQLLWDSRWKLCLFLEMRDAILETLCILRRGHLFETQSRSWLEFISTYFLASAYPCGLISYGLSKRLDSGNLVYHIIDSLNFLPTSISPVMLFFTVTMIGIHSLTSRKHGGHSGHAVLPQSASFGSFSYGATILQNFACDCGQRYKGADFLF